MEAAKIGGIGDITNITNIDIALRGNSNTGLKLAAVRKQP